MVRDVKSNRKWFYRCIAFGEAPEEVIKMIQGLENLYYEDSL